MASMTSTPAPALVPGELTPEVSEGLFRRNVLAGIVHAVQAVAILVLATDFALPVTTAILNDDPANALGGITSIQPELAFEIRTAWAVAAFSLLSALAHGLIAFPLRGRYEAYLAVGRNPYRWVEYSISSTIMVVVIAQLTSIFDLVALLGLAGCNVLMILFGELMERRNAGRTAQDTQWSAFWFGSLAGAVPWIAITIHLVIGDPPGFVYAIFVSLFAFFNVFALNQWAEFRRIGKFADPLHVERTYILLSFLAKSALAWQVFAGTLRP